MSAGLRAGIHGLSGHGHMFPPVVLCDSPGTDGVSDQEASSGGGNPLREGAHLPSGKVCGQDPKEALFGKRKY